MTVYYNEIDPFAAAKRDFARLWRDPNVSQADLSRRYGVAWTTIWRWGKALKLGPKVRPE